VRRGQNLFVGDGYLHCGKVDFFYSATKVRSL